MCSCMCETLEQDVIRTMTLPVELTSQAAVYQIRFGKTLHDDYKLLRFCLTQWEKNKDLGKSLQKFGNFE